MCPGLKKDTNNKQKKKKAKAKKNGHIYGPVTRNPRGERARLVGHENA